MSEFVEVGLSCGLDSVIIILKLLNHSYIQFNYSSYWVNFTLALKCYLQCVNLVNVVAD
ncbi:MAG: hypothetical protein ACEPOW_03325 [Bacteroidales bacterium]